MGAAGVTFYLNTGGRLWQRIEPGKENILDQPGRTLTIRAYLTLDAGTNLQSYDLEINPYHDMSFTGKFLEPSIGLVYFGGRWYEPGIGRWVTVDPVEDGVNWYQYCRSNPVMYVDPDGKSALEIKLDEIEDRYRQMIQSAREKGYHVAADNLQRFLDGVGGTVYLDSKWLRNFSSVIEAQNVNNERFSKQISKKAYNLRDGQTITFTDYWDRQATASPSTELYYASGTFTITSTGRFTLTRRGNKITIKGTVAHFWHDDYDWHAGLTAFIPGFGNISDSDALLLQEHRGAAPFKMESSWKQSFGGEIIIKRWWFDSSDFKWIDML